MLRIHFSLFLGLLLVSSATAGPGHDHGDHGAETASPNVQIPRIESVGSEIELVATAKAHTLTIFLDRSATNEPIDNAEIEVSGEGIAPTKAVRTAVGIYALEANWLDVPGTKALVFMVLAGDVAELLNGTLSVSANDEHAAPKRAPLAEVLFRTDILAILLGTVALGFVLAFAIRIRTKRDIDRTSTEPKISQSGVSLVSMRDAAEILVVVVLAGALMPSLALAGPGHDHGDGGHDEAPVQARGIAPARLPDGSVFVPKATQRLLQVRTAPAAVSSAPRTQELIGTVVSDPAAFGQVQAPMDGRIEVNERGISFPGQRVQAGEVLALLSPTIPLADLGTMQQLRAEVEGKLIIAEQKLARLKKISDVVAQRDIEDTKAEVNALREQTRVLTPKDVEKVPLKAPVGGVISLANVRAGQVVSARDTLFEIVDPERLWVEGIGTDIHGDGDIASAYAQDGEGHSITLAYAGRSPTLRQQARPFLFRVEGAHSGLAIGAPVKVFVQSRESDVGIVIPDAAVVRGTNGLAQVWVKVAPEQFRPAPVRTLQLDSSRSLLLSGIETGDRVVIAGAELINQIR